MAVRDQDIEAVAKVTGPPGRRILKEIIRSLDAHSNILGVDPHNSQAIRQDQQLGQPQQGTLAVTGMNGHFYVTITPPLPGVSRVSGPVPKHFENHVGTRNFREGDPWGDNDARISRMQDLTLLNDGRRLGRLLHQVQSAKTLKFDAAGGVTTYGPSNQTSYDQLDPNQQKYWRYRSRYENSNYNEWTYYSNPATCGPVAVDSGLLTSPAIVMVNQANTPNGTSPLTNGGFLTRISVAPTTWTMGSQMLAYNAGSVDPGAFGGPYYVYAMDPRRQGGVVTYIASLNNPDITSADSIVFFGIITTVMGTPGTGKGGGGGACCVRGVLVEMADGSFKDVSRILPGDLLRGIDGDVDRVVRVELAPGTPCMRFEMDNGVVLKGCSPTHALQYDGGGFEIAFNLVVGERLNTRKGPARIAKKIPIGYQTVYKIHLDRSKTYWTDDMPSHNANKQ